MSLHQSPEAAHDAGRDFIDLNQVDKADLKTILKLAHTLKRAPLTFRPMEGKTLAMIFEKPSTRTRVSFEVGMHQLGGHALMLSGAEMQLGHGESVADTGRVLSRFADIIMLRTFGVEKLTELALGATVPVINGLTNASHPCQVMADIMTWEERMGSLTGKRVVWLGDGSDNVLISWMHAAPLFDFTLRIICPPEFAPPQDVLIAVQKQGGKISVMADINDVRGADIVLTDCWVSMHNSDAALRHERLQPYQVNAKLMAQANASALFMHCLPAHRGEEVTNDVIDGLQSVVWDEAENRMHVQKAIMCWCLGIKGP